MKKENKIEFSFHGDKDAFNDLEFKKSFIKMIELAYKKVSDEKGK